MRSILLAVGAVGALAALALVMRGADLTIDAADRLSSTRLGNTRTPVPGTRGIDLEAGKYTVFYEVEDGSEDSDEIHVPALDLSIRAAGDEAPLELDGFTGDLDISSGGRAATAIGTTRVPEDGRYRIRVRSRADAAVPAIVLGRPVTGRVVRLLLGVAALAGGLGLGALTLAVAIALRTRSAKEPRA